VSPNKLNRLTALFLNGGTVNSHRQELKIRIHAQQIRQRLLGRNNGVFFREMLAQLSDEELVNLAEEHHAHSVAFAREKNVNG
jgi:hypothetical protein